MQTTSEAAVADKSFAELFSEFEDRRSVSEGSSIDVLVRSVAGNRVRVAAGLKADCEIPTDEFRAQDGTIDVKPGDYVTVKIELLDDGRGNTRLSRLQHLREQAWISIKNAHEDGTPIEGLIQERVKGGYSVIINGLRCFLPGSLVDIFPITDQNELIGKVERFLVKRVYDRQSAILNRKELRERELVGNDMTKITFAEGDVVKGKVAAIAEYPESTAFVKINEKLHGRLHRSDLSWSRINQIGDILSLDQEIEVKILRIDHEEQRIHVGVKHIQPDPLEQIINTYPPGSRVFGRVTAVKEYGAFVEIESGIEGLVHVSEMDWRTNSINPERILSPEDEVEVMVLNIEMKNRRISLGIKQCTPNPWEDFATAYRKGAKLSGKIDSKVEFGIFVALADGLNGLVHISDLSYTESGADVLKEMRVGTQVDVVLLSVDVEKQRISLGIKQLAHEEFDKYISANPNRSLVSGEVIHVDERTARVQLAQNVIATLPSREAKTEKVRDLSEFIKVGDKVEAMIINIDADKHHISLSLKAKERAATNEGIRELRKRNKEIAGDTTSFGEMVKQTLGDQSDSEQDKPTPPPTAEATETPAATAEQDSKDSSVPSAEAESAPADEAKPAPISPFAGDGDKT